MKSNPCMAWHSVTEKMSNHYHPEFGCRGSRNEVEQPRSCGHWKNVVAASLRDFANHGTGSGPKGSFGDDNLLSVILSGAKELTGR